MAKQTVVDKIEQIRKSMFVDDRYHNYQHSVQLSGWLISKPVIRHLTNDKVVANFFIYQVNERNYKPFSCTTYSKPIIDTLEQVEGCCLISLLGLLTYSPKTRYNLQVEEIAISYTFTDLPLDPPYYE